MFAIKYKYETITMYRVNAAQLAERNKSDNNILIPDDEYFFPP